MKIPRFSISGLMALVALVALDIASIKAFTGPSFLNRHMSDLMLCGMLPMANVLALGLLPFLSRPGPIGGRPFLVRFEVFGGLALSLFFALCSMATNAVHEGVGKSIEFLGIGPSPLFLAGVVAVMLLPQLAFAWLGAMLSGNKARELFPQKKPHPDDLIDFL